MRMFVPCIFSLQMSKRIQAILDNPNIKKLYEYYIQREVTIKKTFSSPLRSKDKHPSFNIYPSNSKKLLFKDFAGEQGDIIDFVKQLFNLSTKEAIDKIENDLNIKSLSIYPKRHKLRLDTDHSVSSVSITIKDKNKHYSDDEKNWFKEFKISKKTAIKYHFYSANEVEIKTKNRINQFFNWPNNPLFYIAYPSGRYKIYRPLSNKAYKWRCNTNADDIFGMWLLEPKEPAIIICSGPKDCMSLHSNTGYKTICLSSETAYLSVERYYQLRDITENLFILFDNDDAGFKASCRWKERYLVKDLRPYLPKQYKDVALYYKFLEGEDTLHTKINELLHEQTKRNWSSDRSDDN